MVIVCPSRLHSHAKRDKTPAVSAKNEALLAVAASPEASADTVSVVVDAGGVVGGSVELVSADGAGATGGLVVDAAGGGGGTTPLGTGSVPLGAGT